MKTAPDSEIDEVSLSNSAIFIFDARFALGDVTVTKDCRRALIETGPVDRQILRDLLSAWGSIARDAPAAAAEDAPPPQSRAAAIPSESIWAQKAIPSESIWAQKAIPSESIWAQKAIPSESIWTQRAVPGPPDMGAPANPDAESEAETMFASLGLRPAITPFHVPLSLVGTLPSGKRCAIVINRALKLHVSTSPNVIRVDTDGAGHELLIVNG
jgi:hypothetical protein